MYFFQYILSSVNSGPALVYTLVFIFLNDAIFLFKILLYTGFVFRNVEFSILSSVSLREHVFMLLDPIGSAIICQHQSYMGMISFQCSGIEFWNTFRVCMTVYAMLTVVEQNIWFNLTPNCSFIYTIIPAQILLF